MRRNKTQPLHEILQDLAIEQNLDYKLDEMKLIGLWPEVVGEAINHYTTHLTIYNRQLFVTLTSAPLRHELSFYREELIVRLNRKAGKKIIDNIIFR